jgi:mono/diheme cytochrome c family protein
LSGREIIEGLPSSIVIAFCYDSSMERQRSWVLIPLLGGMVGCAPGSPQESAAAAAPAVAPPGSPMTGAGAELFNGNCSACHQQSGQGVPGVYPALAGSPTVLGDPKALARWVIHGQRAPSMPAGRYSTAMPQFGWLKDADAAALFTYLRSSFGNHAPPVDAATVARAPGE